MANVKIEIKMDSTENSVNNLSSDSSSYTYNVGTNDYYSNNNVGFKTNIDVYSEEDYAMYVLRLVYESLTLQPADDLTDEEVLSALCNIAGVTYVPNNFQTNFNNIYSGLLSKTPTGDLTKDAVTLYETFFFTSDAIKKYQQYTYPNFTGTELLTWQGEQGVLYFNQEGNLSNSTTGKSGELSSEQNRRQFVFRRNLEDNEFSITFKLWVDSSQTQPFNFQKILVVGDSVANQFPTEAIIDGETTIYSDDPYWVIQFDSQETSHTIQFTKWNRKDYNAVINQIIIMYDYYTIDKYNGLKAMNTLIQSTPTPQNINYGVISSSGYAEIIDIQGEIQDLIEDGIIPKSDVPVVLKINEKPVNYGVISDSSYNETKEYNININDKLGYLENIKFSSDYKEEDYSLYSFMMDIFSKFVLDMYNVQDLNSFLAYESDYVEYGIGVKEYLQSIILYSSYMSETTVRDALNKVCNVAQINIFLNSDNKIHIVNSRPQYRSEENIIVIPRRNQYSDLQYDLTTNNVFDGIEMFEYQKNEKIETEVAIYQTGEIDTSSLSISNLTTSDLNTQVSTSNIISRRNYGSSTSGISAFRFYGFIYARDFYYGNIDTITLPKSSNSNLSKILSISTTSAFKDGQPIYKIIYRVRKYSCSANMNTNSGQISSFSFAVNQNANSSSGNFPSKYNYDYGGNDTLSLTISDSSTLTVTQDGDNYVISGINLLSARQYVYMGSSGYLISPSSAELTGTYVTYEPVGLQITFYGNTVTVSFEARDVSTEDIEHSKNKISFEDNILINQNTSYMGINISKIIKDDIFNDYSSGIRTGTIKVNPDNYYNTNGDVVKNWDNGDLFRVGDLVRIDIDNNGTSQIKYKDGSDYYWRVTGVKPTYDSEILLELQVQEAKLGYSGYGLYDNNGNIVLSWNALIDNGLITVSNNTLTLVSNSLFGILKIDDSITVIAPRALYGFNGSEVILPNSVTTIGAYAFANSSGLQSVTLSSSMTSIPTYMFNNDSALKRIFIPNSIISIASYAFNNCNALEDVYYSGTETEWNNISIGPNNSALDYATIHYNS